MRSLRLSRKLFASLPAPTTVGCPISVEPPMFIVLGCGVYLFSMIDAACVRREGGITFFTPLYSNCCRMYWGFDLLAGNAGLNPGFGWVVVGSKISTPLWLKS